VDKEEDVESMKGRKKSKKGDKERGERERERTSVERGTMLRRDKQGWR